MKSDLFEINPSGNVISSQSWCVSWSSIFHEEGALDVFRILRKKLGNPQAKAGHLTDFLLLEAMRTLIFSRFSGVRADFARPTLPFIWSWTEPTSFHFFIVLINCLHSSYPLDAQTSFWIFFRLQSLISFQSWIRWWRISLVYWVAPWCCFHSHDLIQFYQVSSITDRVKNWFKQKYKFSAFWRH